MDRKNNLMRKFLRKQDPQSKCGLQEAGENFHVFKISEINDHVLVGVDCPCSPRVEKYANGNQIVVHKRIQ